MSSGRSSVSPLAKALALLLLASATVLVLGVPSVTHATVEVYASCPNPSGTVGVPYSSSIVATVVGSPDLGYTVESFAGSPPPGLGLDSFGVVSGTPTLAGSSTFSVLVVSNADPSADAVIICNIVISPAIGAPEFPIATLGPLLVTALLFPALAVTRRRSSEPA